MAGPKSGETTAKVRAGKTVPSGPSRRRHHSLAASAGRVPCGKDRKACRVVVVAAGAAAAAEESRIPASRNPASAADDESSAAVVAALPDGELSTATPNRNNPPDWPARPHLLCLWPPPERRQHAQHFVLGVHSSV